MIFKRKKDASVVTGTASPRGRDSVPSGDSSSAPVPSNPLARRFSADDEPDTIDLASGSQFIDDATVETAGPRISLISFDAMTGKICVEPGQERLRLNGKPVSVGMALESGDRIQLGGAELHFLSVEDDHR